MKRASRRRGIALAVALVAGTTLLGGTVLGSAGASAGSGGTVVVPRGQPVQVVFTADTAEFPAFTTGFENAIRMAVDAHPTIRGFPVQVNDVETVCAADNAPVASGIVADPQTAAVIGHVCSAGFVTALPVYETANVVTISGSATADWLAAAPGSDVFNRVVVRDGDHAEVWLAAMSALPSVVAWADDYKARFGTAAPDFAALYYDAASLLLRRLQTVSKVVDGSLVVDRAALAAAVRGTTRYQGVTCSITLDPATGNRVNDPDALARCAG